MVYERMHCKRCIPFQQCNNLCRQSFSLSSPVFLALCYSTVPFLSRLIKTLTFLKKNRKLDTQSTAHVVTRSTWNSDPVGADSTLGINSQHLIPGNGLPGRGALSHTSSPVRRNLGHNTLQLKHTFTVFYLYNKAGPPVRTSVVRTGIHINRTPNINGRQPT